MFDRRKQDWFTAPRLQLVQPRTSPSRIPRSCQPIPARTVSQIRRDASRRVSRFASYFLSHVKTQKQAGALSVMVPGFAGLDKVKCKWPCSNMQDMCISELKEFKL